MVLKYRSGKQMRVRIVRSYLSGNMNVDVLVSDN